ncbi:MAG: glutathione S-transferase [Cyanobacteria bacterium SW_9_44_58]|nr:MAG: glutathione S-transferase [Cyanobacteria bacterium SW_9_44_58]
MKLYYIPLTRATRPRWLLEEMELSYELINVVENPHRFEHKQRHPHGKVPVFVDNYVAIYESTAICAYLADQYPEKQFAPSSKSPARAYYYQWLFYASVTLEAPVEKYLFQKNPHLPESLSPNSERQSLSQEEILQWFARVCQPLHQHLNNNNYLVENQLTTADIVTGGVLYWAFLLGMMTEQTLVKNYLMRLMERPAFKRVHEKNVENLNYPQC